LFNNNPFKQYLLVNVIEHLKFKFLTRVTGHYDGFSELEDTGTKL